MRKRVRTKIPPLLRLTSVENRPGRCEAENGSSDDADSPVVGGVEFEHHGGKLLGPVKLLGASQDRRRLPRPGRTVEEQVGQPILRHVLPDRA